MGRPTKNDVIFGTGLLTLVRIRNFHGGIAVKVCYFGCLKRTTRRRVRRELRQKAFTTSYRNGLLYIDMLTGRLTWL